MKPAGGFTLLELLVALAVFAIVGLAAYAGLAAVLATRSRLEAEAAHLTEVRRALDLLAQDLAQLADRPVRDALGRTQPALAGDALARPLLEFTRAGWPNPQQAPRAGLHRVAYVLRDATLYRLDWAALDRVDAAAPRESPLLGQVGQVRLRFLDAAQGWLPTWPPREAAGAARVPLPRAVEFTLVLAGWGELTRLVAVPGAPRVP